MLEIFLPYCSSLDKNKNAINAIMTLLDIQLKSILFRKYFVLKLFLNNISQFGLLSNYNI